MSETKLGQLIDGTARRDAVHVAIAPVQAAERMTPGQRCGVRFDGCAWTRAKIIGIVDPFLTEPVEEGQWFYLCLFPGTVTGMRHHWSHPSFEEGR